MSMTIDDDDYLHRLEEAIESREDGDVEESVSLFQDALRIRPGDVKGTLEYTNTLKRLRRFDEADEVYVAAMKLHPDSVDLCNAWAHVPLLTCDHEETVRRAKVLRGAFPPVEHDLVWNNLDPQFRALVEMQRWHEARDLVLEQLDNTAEHATAFRICLWHATDLGFIEEQKMMIAAARPKAWSQLSPEAQENVRLRIEMSELNSQLCAETQLRVISIGQNCLPYMVCGRWGLIPDREKAERMTPFDRGAYQKKNAAAVIESDFAGILDRQVYKEIRSWEQNRMYEHAPTGVYFYHERGAYWFENEGERFFPLLSRQIANWQEVSRQGRRLFVFCLCGEGDLANLVEVMDRLLLGPDAHLLVLDVLQKPHACPTHQHVTYLHVPYPEHFVWDNFFHQTTAAGVGFEASVSIAVMDRMISFLPAERASFYLNERQRILRHFAAESVLKSNHRNVATLYGMLDRMGDLDLDTSLAHARALWHSGNLSEAQRILARATGLAPMSYDVQAAWVDAGVAPFDWASKLERLTALRKAFPPEVEPKTWERIVEELSILTTHGQWNDAIALIDGRWSDFTARPSLFQPGLDALLHLGQLERAQRLMDEALPAARALQSSDVAACMQLRFDDAEIYRGLVERAGAQVLALGQNTLPALLLARWGLRSGDQRLHELTPFEVGDFFGDATAKTIDDDFEGLLVRKDYVESPAWGGGVVLRHGPTSVAFMTHRDAKIGPAEEKRLFTHLNKMIANWRRVKDNARCIYVYFYVDKGDLSLIIAAAKEKLLGNGSKLIIVNIHERADFQVEEEDIIFVHAPKPPDYLWFSGLGAATSANYIYERRLLAPVIARLREFNLAGRVADVKV